jgi:ferric-dicitrate binding protein FerR (iron transport regulator)
MPLWTLVAMLLIGLGWWVWKPAPITGIAKSTEWTTYTTTAREKQKLELPDGSTVWLNAGSTLRLDQQGMKEGARQVYLEGEAFFDIAHDTSRPFKVRSGSMEIRVLGTAFNVRAYPNDADFETSLIRGAVEVRLDNRPEDVYQLRPHEKLVVSRQTDLPSKAPINMGQSAPASLVSLKKLPVADSGHFVEEIAWLENKVAFQSESFASISGKLERKYGYHFVFENIDASNLQFTGSFTTETIEQALAAMQLVHPFQYRIEKDCIYIR